MSGLDLTAAIKAAQQAVVTELVVGQLDFLVIARRAVVAAAPLIRKAEREYWAARFDQMGDTPGAVETFTDQVWWQAAGMLRNGKDPVEEPVNIAHRQAAYNTDPCPGGGNHDWVPVLKARVPTGREYCRGCDTSRVAEQHDTEGASP